MAQAMVADLDSRGLVSVLSYSVPQGWALVPGGPPKEISGDACKTGEGTNNSGLWVVTREKPPQEDPVQKVVGLAETKGSM